MSAVTITDPHLEDRAYSLHAVPPGSRATSHGAVELATVVAAEVARAGKWETWCESDPRLAGVACLEDAVADWRVRRDPRGYQVIAALTAIGSRRGGDDDDAAMAVVVLLGPGIARLASLLRDVCEIDDVRATVWEEVKLAEPQLGRLAARYLLQRAQQRLTRPSAGMVSRGYNVSLDQWLGWASNDESGPRQGERCAEVAAPEVEDPVTDLADLLTWARQVGVIEAGEVDLIVELVAAAHEGVATEDAQRLIGKRHGVAMRTIRRRRDATLARLREAAPAYLAATG